MFNINELRSNERRTDVCRRIADRRITSFAFGSSEWQANIASGYAYCPNSERRLGNRRDQDRRTMERRQQHFEPVRPARNRHQRQMILLPEERKLIEDLFLCDERQ